MKKDHALPGDVDRIVTPTELRAQFRGARRVAPGIWLDADGDPHVSVPELLRVFGWPDTPANREGVAAIVADVTRAHGVTIIRQDPES